MILVRMCPAKWITLILLFYIGTATGWAKAVRWNYELNPVKAAENGPVSPLKHTGIDVQSAFDGYGAQGSKPAAVRTWFQTILPTNERPLACEIDFGKPVGVTAFAHYFYVPGNRDLRSLSPAPSAFKRVRISISDDAVKWMQVTLLNDLPADCPQVLPITQSKSARFWRIEVLELAPGAEFLSTYEIETYTGGVPKIQPPELNDVDLPSEFAKRIGTQRSSGFEIRGRLETNSDQIQAILELPGKKVTAELKVTADSGPLVLESLGRREWKAREGKGSVQISYQQTSTGLLLSLAYTASPSNPVKYQKVGLEIRTPSVELYYIPAYVWSSKSKNILVNSCKLQTRMGGLLTNGTMLCLIPGTDRGNLGFANGALRNELLLGENPTPVLLTAIPGDWWQSYKFAVNEVFDFKEPLQTVPVSEIQYGISRYLLSSEVWEPTLGTVRSWPENDPHTKMIGFDAFLLYGVPYSIPSYWARYVMNGERVALERCRSIVKWLCRSGIRVNDGPTRGAFFTLQRFKNGDLPSFGKQGESWPGSILTSQSTGAGLWSLLYYRRVSGEGDSELNSVIEEAADWLLRSQEIQGGWPFAHDVSGKVVQGAPSSGAIWNIWALWVLGKETGDSRYLRAAEQGKSWFVKEFVEPHHYHGYWEDVGPGSREGYEAAIAAVAFAEMGEKSLVVETAKDAVQWVFTRQVETREPNNSAGLVAEQAGWPPASYCNPMMGLAAWAAWQTTGDEFWRPFAMIPRAIGWWYQPDPGAMVWIVDSTQLAPVVGPSFESWWCDWTIAQVGTLTLRWLVHEFERASKGSIVIDQDTLEGCVLGKSVRTWAPSGGFKPIIPIHGQVNWLGFRGDDCVMLGLLNYGSSGPVACTLNSRNTNGVNGATTWPRAIYYVHSATVRRQAWDGTLPIQVPSNEAVIVEWGIRR